MRTLLFLLLVIAGIGIDARGEEILEADLCVVEATPGGIACAIRAAREGLDVVLVNRTAHPGGILSSGLGVWDTIWEGKRSPIYDELRQAIFDHYRETYGEDSPQYRHALPGASGHTNGKFEPRVVERLITEMIQREQPKLRLITGFVPESAEREGRLLKTVAFREFEGDRSLIVKASTFADATYEGDLLPLAGVAYRVGRESRDEFDEPHAGKVFLRATKQRPESISAAEFEAHEQLAVRKFSGFQEIVQPESTGEGDENVQAFNYRTILTDDPDNRIPATKPDDYDPEFLQTLEYGSIVRPLPNRKIGWNRPQLVGPHQAYVEGGWDTRQQAMDAHWNATLGLLWFLQHDPSVPEEKREHWLRYGLAKDEFPDHGHRPYEIYVREARRLVGRHVLTQHDLMPAPGTLRPPTYPDAIAMTDWYMDSHAVTGRGNGVHGSLDEGKMMLHAETWPGQIPWRCLLPKELDNLIVPVCFSATHVAWGAIRLEPTWMQTGESAGLAAALARQEEIPIAKLDPKKLVRQLAEDRSFIAFFNDLPLEAPSAPAALFLGGHGFFPTCDLRLDEPVSEAVKKAWEQEVTRIQQGESIDPAALAKSVFAEEKQSPLADQTRGEVLTELWSKLFHEE